MRHQTRLNNNSKISNNSNNSKISNNSNNSSNTYCNRNWACNPGKYHLRDEGRREEIRDVAMSDDAREEKAKDITPRRW